MTRLWAEFNRFLCRRGRTAILLVIIGFGVLARLYNVSAPLLEWHFYRQLDTAAVTRNLYENGMNILYPQVDWRGASPGYVELEFPVYNFSVALLYHLFGPQEWVGRAFNVLIYTVSAILLFCFARRLSDERVALLAVFFYSVSPLSFEFTRAFQPDALLALNSLAAVYYFWVWAEDNRTWALLLSFIGLTLAILIKPPSVYLAIPLLYLAQRKFGWQLFRKPILWCFAGAALIPSVLWYYHGYQLWKNYGNTFGIFAMNTIAGYWPVTDIRWIKLGGRVAWQLIFEIATPPGLLLLVVGFFATLRTSNKLILSWVAGFSLYILLVPKGHYGHDYYRLPLVFIVGLYMAHGLVCLAKHKYLTRSYTVAVLLAVVGFSTWQIKTMMYIPEEHWQRLTFAQRVNHLTEPVARMVFVVPRPFHPQNLEIYRHRTAQGEILYCDPVDFYLSHRKGWSLDDVQARTDFVETLRQRGAQYFATFYPVIFKDHPDLKEALDTSYVPVEVTSRWALYRLEQSVVSR